MDIDNNDKKAIKTLSIILIIFISGIFFLSNSVKINLNNDNYNFSDYDDLTLQELYNLGWVFNDEESQDYDVDMAIYSSSVGLP